MKEVNLYGELHRFVPALASSYGARIVEVPVRRVGRRNGGSRNGLDPAFHVLLDILTVGFLLRYLTRPMHFFGTWALASIGAGSLMLLALLAGRIAGHDILAEYGFVLFSGGMLWFAGLMSFSTGLIGEMLMRTYFESRGRRSYAIREVRTRREQLVDGTR